MNGHTYFQSPREVEPGDAAYLIHDDGWHGQWVPVVVVRVNRVSVTLATRNGTNVRLPHNAPSGNVALSWAGADEDEDHVAVRRRLAA